MIATITRAVAAAMLARGYPYGVSYGESRFTSTTIGEPRVTIKRDRKSRKDVAHAPLTHAMNPPIRAQRTIACVVRVYARSTLAGAQLEDHERLADKTVDMLIVALQKVVSAPAETSVIGGPTTAAIGAGGYLSAAELALDGMEAWPGVVYEFALTVERGVRDTTWADEAREETTTLIHTSGGTCTTTAAPT